MAFADDGYFLEVHGRQGLVVRVARDAGDGLNNQNAGVVALAEECVVLVERVIGLLGNEELAAVGVGSGVGHGKAAGPVEIQVGIDLVVKSESRIAGASAGGVAALNHELGNDAVKGGVVEVGLVVLLFHGGGVGPVNGSFGEADEVGYRLWRLLLVELASDAAHGGIHDHGRAAGVDHGRGGSLGCIGQRLCGRRSGLLRSGRGRHTSRKG